ncbi:MAG: tetratricopeptide repeat protein [Phycisphaerae bacterium]
MTPDRWQRVKQLFHAALPMETQARKAFLDEACGDDAMLRLEVESLIASHEQGSSFFEVPAIQLATSDLGEPRTEVGSRRRIGPYEVTRQIGSGGMATVYLAVRADDAYQKRVAIKVVRDVTGSVDTPRARELLRRFNTERQTLANLDHPNIARLLDGGATDDGAPYLVMDYIEGEPINAYCDRRQLATGERLKLFRSVCAAVQYAHQNLVVHRDLKPGNILVTSDGVAKLLDFGIAKLLDVSETSRAADPTQTGMRLMTPAYASPEQARGQPITTASDVYSLGVILYELLTGHRPYRIASRAEHEVARAICETEPEKPSSVISRLEEIDDPSGTSHITLTPESVSKTRDGTPDRLRRRLAGDIDVIVLMALRKEPQRRYASVEQFSEDIRRHLEGRPVLARKSTLAYRSAKFMRRHALGVSAAAVVVLALTGGILGTSWQAHIAQVAERRAEDEAETAREVSEYLTRVFEVSDPLFSSIPGARKGTEVTAGEILQAGAERIEAELKDRPAVQAAVMNTIGNVYANLDAYDEAERLLQRALEIRRQTFGDEHPDVAASLQSLGHLFMKKGDYARAEPSMRDALAMRRRLLGEEHQKIAASLDGLGTLYTHMGDYARAETYYEQALDMYRKVLGPGHLFVAMSLANRATILHSQGQYVAAEPVYREALELLRAAQGDEHPDVATVMQNLAVLLQTQDEFEEAETLLRKALDLRVRLYGEEHRAVAQSLHNLAHLVTGRGDFEDARPLYEQALAIRRRVLGGDHPKVAETLNDLAYLYYVGGDFARAEPLFREAQAIERTRYPEGHPSLALKLHNLASVYAAQGRYADAQEMFREALEMRRRRLGDRHPDTAETLNNLGGLLYLLGNLAEAEPLLREALEIRRETFGNEHQTVAATCNSLGAVLREKGEYDAGETLLRKSLQTRQKIFPPSHPALASSLIQIGELLTVTDRAEEAQPLLRQALQIRRTRFGNHWLTANSTSALGACLIELEQYEEAEPLLMESYAELRAARGEHDPFTLRALRRIIDLHDAWNKPDQAAEWRAKLPSSFEETQAAPPGQGDGG